MRTQSNCWDSPASFEGLRFRVRQGAGSLAGEQEAGPAAAFGLPSYFGTSKCFLARVPYFQPTRWFSARPPSLSQAAGATPFACGVPKLSPRLLAVSRGEWLLHTNQPIHCTTVTLSLTPAGCCSLGHFHCSPVLVRRSRNRLPDHNNGRHRCLVGGAGPF